MDKQEDCRISNKIGEKFHIELEEICVGDMYVIRIGRSHNKHTVCWFKASWFLTQVRIFLRKMKRDNKKFKKKKLGDCVTREQEMGQRENRAIDVPEKSCPLILFL